MYRRLPQRVAAVCCRRAATSIKALWLSGKAPVNSGGIVSYYQWDAAGRMVLAELAGGW
jgi:hypothetical protein